MKPSLIIFLLLLSLLYESQGIRLEKGFKSIGHHKVHEEEKSALIKTSNGGVGEVDIFCKEGQYCSGKNRKLVTVTSTSTLTFTTSKNEKNGVNNAKPTSKGKRSDASKVGFDHQEVAHEQYPDITDITEMDYSPARRKPPIHN